MCTATSAAAIPTTIDSLRTNAAPRAWARAAVDAPTAAGSAKGMRVVALMGDAPLRSRSGPAARRSDERAIDDVAPGAADASHRFVSFARGVHRLCERDAARRFAEGG